MQNIPRWKKSDRGSSHFRHGLDLRLIILRICVLKFAHFIISVARSVNCQVNNMYTQLLSLCFSLIHVYSQGILVENCVVEICNNDMFLQFYELTLEMKYFAGVHKRH